MKHMSLNEIATACSGVYYGDSTLLAKEVDGVVIDSRLVKENDLFIPIRGARVDGHDFIPSVMDAGALCTLSEKLLEGTSFPYILVNSCEQALKDLAEYYRCSLDIKVVGITGSVGKTSTKEMIASVLEQKYHVLKTDGNYNNEIGLPLTIFKIQPEHEIAILELGISDFGEMTRLAKIARPDVCVITNIGLCHLEFLKSREGVLKAKTEIFNYLQPGGSIILNGDDDMLSTIGKTKGTVPYFFGLSEQYNAYASQITNLGLKGTSCHLHFFSEVTPVTISIPGRHMVYNALAGACVGHVFNLTASQIKAGIEQLRPVSGRNNILTTELFTVIDDCYNANPISTKASLEVLSNATGRTVAILGDMGELGANETQLHYDVGAYATHLGIQVIVCIGELAKNIAKGAQDTTSLNPTNAPLILHYSNKEKFLNDRTNLLKKDDTILIKASHFMNFSTLVDALIN